MGSWISNPTPRVRVRRLVGLLVVIAAMLALTVWLRR
jgi:hypothetical protein